MEDLETELKHVNGESVIPIVFPRRVNLLQLDTQNLATGFAAGGGGTTPSLFDAIMRTLTAKPQPALCHGRIWR